MNSHISVDRHENIVIKTDTCPTADELLAAVCEYPFLIDVIIEQTLPKLQMYAEDNFGCELKIDTLCMIEGHTSVEVTLKHSAGKEDVSLVISILRRTYSLIENYCEDFSWVSTITLLHLQSL